MIEIIPSGSRGHAQRGWLESQHTFSFGEYQNPDRMGIGPLRVFNEDRVAPGTGFSEHSHRDVEIISYVLSGRLEHKDSMGNGSAIKAGSFQHMRAGEGIRHSEWNSDPVKPLHFLQIWIQPSKLGLNPSYQEYHPSAGRRDLITQIASGSDEAAPIQIESDAEISQVQLYEGETITVQTKPGRQFFLHIAHGTSKLGNGTSLEAGDAALLRGEPLELGTSTFADVLLFGLPTRGD